MFDTSTNFIKQIPHTDLVEAGWERSGHSEVGTVRADTHTALEFIQNKSISPDLVTCYGSQGNWCKVLKEGFGLRRQDVLLRPEG